MLRNASEIRIWNKYLVLQRSLSMSVLNAVTSAVKSVSMSLENTDKTEACLSFSDGITKVSLTLGMGAKHIEIKPITNATFIKVHTKANYAVIPGFASEDKVYEVATNMPVPLIAPAQSVILELLEVMDSILLLMWTNTTEASTSSAITEPITDEISRNVELYSTNRIFTSTRIGFLGKSIYLGLISEPRIWCSVNNTQHSWRHTKTD